MQKGTKHTDESKALMSSKAQQRPPRSAEVKERIRATLKARHARIVQEREGKQ